MGTGKRFAAAFLGCIAFLACGAAIAAIPNGDLEDANELNYWLKVAIVDPSDSNYAVVNETTDPPSNDRLHLLAKNSYTWWGEANGWLRDQIIDSSAEAINPYDPMDPNYRLYAPAGTTTVQFEAKIEIDTAESRAQPLANLWVKIRYNDGNAVAETYFYSTTDWNVYTIDLPGVNLSESVSLLVHAGSRVDLDYVADGGTVGEKFYPVAEGWFDNFQFIPEPCSLALLVVGSAVFVLGRRKLQ